MGARVLTTADKVASGGSVERYSSIIHATLAKNVMSYSSSSAFGDQVLLSMPHLIQVFGVISIYICTLLDYGSIVGDVVRGVTTL